LRIVEIRTGTSGTAVHNIVFDVTDGTVVAEPDGALHCEWWQGRGRKMLIRLCGKRPLGKHSHRGETNTKIYFGNNDGRTWIGLIWLRIGTRDRLLCTR
jgi:hypothetical protein